MLLNLRAVFRIFYTDFEEQYKIKTNTMRIGLAVQPVPVARLFTGHR